MKLKLIVLNIYVGVFVLVNFAQTYEWTKTFGSAVWDIGHSNAVDDFGIIPPKKRTAD